MMRHVVKNTLYQDIVMVRFIGNLIALMFVLLVAIPLILAVITLWSIVALAGLILALFD